MSMKVLVVGCSGGIGTAISRHLKKEGYDIVGVDKDDPSDESLFSAFYRLDLRNADDVVSLVEKLKAGKHFWALVYVAGIYPIVPFDEYSLKLWDEVQSVNVRSAFIILKGLADDVERGGRIVTIVSGAAHIGSRDLGYSASKAALLGLTKSLALNLAKRGILVNAVCPGVIDTKMSARMHPEDVEKYMEKILLKRKGMPEEVAAGVSFLLNKENTYMTGATININGGLYINA
ncbi:MAG: SDR family NAD(P)-dependent oxidoreductase [Candidatus Micrarchaeia archaeon]